MSLTPTRTLDMAKYARLNPDNTIAEIRSDLRELPPDIPHKNVRWRAVAESPAISTEFYTLGDYSLSGDAVVRQKVARSIGEVRTRMVGKVKAIAQRKILAIMPAYKQTNLMALAVENIRAYGPDSSKWPEQMRAIAADADAKWARIKAIRVASDVIEADIMAADFAALEAFDLSKGWPE